MKREQTTLYSIFLGICLLAEPGATWLHSPLVLKLNAKCLTSTQSPGKIFSQFRLLSVINKKINQPFYSQSISFSNKVSPLFFIAS